MPAGQGLAITSLPHVGFHRLYVMACGGPMLIVTGMGRGPLGWLSFDFLVGPAADQQSAERGAEPPFPSGRDDQLTGGFVWWWEGVVAEHLHRIYLLKSSRLGAQTCFLGLFFFGGL
jgi:hypothetical protein